MAIDMVNPFGIDDSNGQGLLDVTVGMSRDEFLGIFSSNLLGMEESNDAIEDAFGSLGICGWEEPDIPVCVPTQFFD